MNQRDDNEKGRRTFKKFYKARLRRLVDCRMRGGSFRGLEPMSTMVLVTELGESERAAWVG